MPRLLAFEYDQLEARVVVAKTTGSAVTFERAFTVDLKPREGAEEAPPVGERLAAALAAHGINRSPVLVAVGRASIELRVLSVPPAPDDELPDMVRFQASQQFSSLGEDWPLDFVKLRSQGDDGQAILAAAIAPGLVEQIQSACTSAGLQPKRMVLRPFAAASLLKRQYSDSRCRLVVDLLTGEADLMVLEEGEVVFLRTVRIPQIENGTPRAVLGEVRRTMLAAQNQLNGSAVQSVVLCGDSEDHAALRQHLDDALDIDVELFDPFSSVTVGGELAEKLPEHHGRFAPLLGMLLDEAEVQSHDIDFLNPRRKVEKKQPILAYALGGTVAVLTLLAIGLFVWSGYAAKAKQIATLKSERTELQKFANDASELVAKVKSIDQWNASNVIWLDELSEVSEEFPPAKDARATLINASSLKTSGGVLWIEGVARDYDVIGQIEIAVDDDRHQVEGGGGSPNERVEGYTYGFKEKITVTQPSRDAEAEEQLVTETP